MVESTSCAGDFGMNEVVCTGTIDVGASNVESCGVRNEDSSLSTGMESIVAILRMLSFAASIRERCTRTYALFNVFCVNFATGSISFFTVD